MLPSSPLLFTLGLLLAVGCVSWILQPHRFRHVGWIAALPPAIVTGWLFTQIDTISSGQTLNESYVWVPQLGLEVTLRLDGLSLLFSLIIAGIGAAVAVYTAYYFENDRRLGYFYSLLFLFMTSMLGIVLSDNVLTLFAFWEGTSITSYLLIGFNDDKEDARDGSRRALVVTGLGGLAMLFGLVVLGIAADTYTISEMLTSPMLAESPVFPFALILILLGAFTKSAQFPFHFWLPGAMSAPTPASAYLHSATMVKAGVFLLARFHPLFHENPIWFWSLLLVGGITMLLGAISALRYYDIKALLAYATVSQLGILVMLLAFSSEEAYIAVAVGILAHALYKGPLFLVAGIVDHATGTRDLRQLGGLWKSMPIVVFISILAPLSMAGIPPFFGFVAKEALLEVYHHLADLGQEGIGWTGLVASAVAGAFFMAYSLTFVWEGFLRPRPNDTESPLVHHPPSFGFVLPPLLLTLLGTVLPFFLVPLSVSILAPAATSIEGAYVDEYVSLWHGWNLVFITTLISLVTGFGIFLIRTPVRALLQSTPASLNGRYLFDKSMDAINAIASWTTRTVQGGTLASQASVVLLTAVAALLYALLKVNWFADFAVDWTNMPHLPEIILAFLSAVAAIVTVRVRTRLNAIISLGVVGIIVTLFFTFFDAPDLALTQLLIDILTVVLLILVFYKIPPQALPPMNRGIQIRNLLVAVAVGGLGFFLVLFSTGTPSNPSISDYFSLNSVPLGHGANIVNVILVDFRAFDTMGEITVLAIAAVGGYALLRSATLRARPGNRRSTQAGKQEVEG